MGRRVGSAPGALMRGKGGGVGFGGDEAGLEGGTAGIDGEEEEHRRHQQREEEGEASHLNVGDERTREKRREEETSAAGRTSCDGKWALRRLCVCVGERWRLRGLSLESRLFASARPGGEEPQTSATQWKATAAAASPPRRLSATTAVDQCGRLAEEGYLLSPVLTCTAAAACGDRRYLCRSLATGDRVTSRCAAGSGRGVGDERSGGPVLASTDLSQSRIIRPLTLNAPDAAGHSLTLSAAHSQLHAAISHVAISRGALRTRRQWNGVFQKIDYYFR